MRTSDRGHWERFWNRGRETREIYDNAGRITGEISRSMDVAGKACLEVGAATARDTAELARMGAFAVALDYSPSALRLASGVCAGTGAVLVCGDAFALPFRDGVFALVFHQGVLEHFREPGGLLRENARVLKEDGLVLVDVPQTIHPYTIVKKLLIMTGAWFAGWETQFTRSSLEALLERSGLAPGRVYGRFMSPSLTYRIIREALFRIGIRLPLDPVVIRPVHDLRAGVRRACEASTLGPTLGYVIGIFAGKARKPRVDGAPDPGCRKPDSASS
jgi:SAM-dependent methyltransferase